MSEGPVVPPASPEGSADGRVDATTPGGAPDADLWVFVLSPPSRAQEALLAAGRLASDERNPFAYVPTRPDVETLAPWLADLAPLAPGGSLEPIAVVGRDYWPLPWYLRQFDRIGYWPEPEGKLAAMPLVFALPEAAEETARLLETTHMPLPRGLRAEVPLHLFVRNDIWNRWMNHE